MANLYEVLIELMAKRQGTRAGRDPAGGELYQPGTIVAVNGDGTYDVAYQGGTVTANPETDLPLSPGQRVYLSHVRNGKPLVHGPRR